MGTDSKFTLGSIKNKGSRHQIRSNKLLRVMVQQVAQLEWEIIQQEMLEKGFEEEEGEMRQEKRRRRRQR